MIDGYVFICPEGSYMGADQYEKVFCALDGDSNWQIQHLNDFAADLPLAASAAVPVASGAEPSSEFDFSVELFGLGFAGMMALFIAGLAVGLIVAQIRKVNKI